ncbi:tail protein [Salmonella typhimurium phage PhiSH19]|uniref:Tail spike protein 1 n=1 Tax=Salmonella typhimurium phage PhiSH19 TaxID=1108865 RepID=G8GDR2_9CAUD|nr:tail protein [Salmonella phage Sh19]AER70268.1 tail spike protein 1 [Salmonella phage Sh19]
MNPQFAQPKGSTSKESNKDSIARKFGCKKSEVVYAKAGQSLSGYKVIYDKLSQRAYALPPNIGAVTVTSLVDGILTHSGGTVDLGALAVLREEYVTLVENFTSGFTIRVKNEVVSDGVSLYRWNGAFPKTVAPGSTPATTGGVGLGAWVSVGDVSLRSELSKEDGFKYIGYSSVEGLRSIEPSTPNQQIMVNRYNDSDAGKSGAGAFYYDPNDTTSADDGTLVIVTTNGKRWKRINPHNDFAYLSGGRYGDFDNTEAMQRCVDGMVSGKIRPPVYINGTIRIDGTVNVNNLDTSVPEKFVSFIGGEIVANGQQYVFSSTEADNASGNIEFVGTNFSQKDTSKVTYIINGQKLIRVLFNGGTVNGLLVAKSNNWLQTLYLTGTKIIRSPQGYALDAGQWFDVRLSKVVFERGWDFARATATGQCVTYSSVTECCIEGSQNGVVIIGGVSGFTFADNTLELMTGQYLDIGASGDKSNSLVVTGNTAYLTADQKASASYFAYNLPAITQNGTSLVQANFTDGNLYSVYPGNQQLISLSGMCGAGKVFLNAANGPTHVRYSLQYGEIERTISALGRDVGVGDVNPQTEPAYYGNITWSTGSYIAKKNPTVVSRNITALGKLADCLLKGWVCQIGGSPGTWVEDLMIL